MPPAVASTSGFSSIRAKKKKDGLLRIKSNGSGSAPNMPFAIPTPNTGTDRKVKTMPPSAVYDPPTPPLPPTELPNVISPTTPRPRPRIRYSTSDESSSSDSDSSDDGRAQYWLMTEEGRARMIQRALRKRKTEGEPEKKKRKFPSRKSSKNEESKPPSITLGPPLPSPIKSRPHFTPHIWRRHSGRSTPEEIQSDSDLPRRRVFTRSNSAPGSAALDTIEASPHPLSSLIMANPPTAEPIPITPVESDPVMARHAKRQMTAPSFRFRRMRSDLGHVSDSEAGPRVKKGRMQSSLARTPPIADSPAPKPRRLNTALAVTKTQLEPISQHFAHGWPHAGSWQDALHGRYEDEVLEERDREVSGETLVAGRDAAVEPPSARSERRKKRTKRYRQALMPPTPKGLGFSPRDEAPDLREQWKEGKVNQTEFDWNSPSTANHSRHAPHPTGSTIPEGDELSRQQTRMTEKSVKRPIKPIKKTGRTKRQGEDWKVRWKRIMFLDARLTIFLRLMDIAVVATLLELIRLQLPGIIGPSTTLTISFASFTLLHATTAIYREYFGKPIGLWGLRSKMLWVCLDLLFVALWSSVLALSTNDYISTPLECTRDDPWWLPGLRTTYAELLTNLAGSGDMSGVTPADLIKATLGIVLPEQIIQAPLAREVCRRQSGCIALALFALLLYAGNMVLSLFRIFETVRRSANVGRAIMV